MAEANGAGLESQAGQSQGQKEYGMIHGGKHALILSVLINMWPLGSLPLSEDGKMNTVHYRVWESVQDQRMQRELERKATLRSR